MVYQWVCFVLETSVRLALVILPAVPLFGQKLPSRADEKRYSVNHPGIVRFEKT
jgi:hypothetical protein